MSKALFLDLRVCVVFAVGAGASHRGAAERFGVSAAGVSRWRALAGKRGEPGPGPLRGDRRVEARGGLIRALLETTPDIAVEEPRAALAERGGRLRMGAPHGRWKTTTFVAGLTMRGMIAPFVPSGPINRDALEASTRDALEACVEKALVPELRPGRIVVVDDLSSHKGPRT